MFIGDIGGKEMVLFTPADLPGDRDRERPFSLQLEYTRLVIRLWFGIAVEEFGDDGLLSSPTKIVAFGDIVDLFSSGYTSLSEEAVVSMDSTSSEPSFGRGTGLGKVKVLKFLKRSDSSMVSLEAWRQ